TQRRARVPEPPRTPGRVARRSRARRPGQRGARDRPRLGRDLRSEIRGARRRAGRGPRRGRRPGACPRRRLRGRHDRARGGGGRSVASRDQRARLSGLDGRDRRAPGADPHGERRVLRRRDARRPTRRRLPLPADRREGRTRDHGARRGGARGGGGPGTAAEDGMTRRPALVAAAVFAAVAAVVYVVLPPGFALFWDNIGQNLPAMLEVHRQLGEGRLPLWNPYMWSGAPLLADPQTEALYPISWLAFAATGPSYARALDLEFVIHLALGGWFLFLYLDALGATRAGAYLGGLVYALNPHFLFVGTGFINWHAAIAWIPAILYGIERARVASRPVRCLAVAAGAFAMQT